ncbi:MAG: hypothetical protein COB76_00040 [Alphaproteobacteria bacterium]|nr:MAG: hypothetical protein COB76_00040 [Alphaproteobacteria bacterium]
MRFDASLKRLQKAVSGLEKASKKAAKSKAGASVNTNQIDMFGGGAPQASNDFDVKELKNQLDEAISSVETLIKESA